MKTKHGGKETKVKCPHCDYRARDKNSVEVHIDRKHQEIAGMCAIFRLKSEEKKRDTFKNWLLIKNLQFLCYLHETWSK